MKPIFKFALRLFLIMTLGMILISIVDDYFFDEEIKMSGIIFKSVFFGFFMSVLFTSIQRYNLISSGVTEITEENLNAYCEGEIVTSLHPDEIFHLLENNHEFKDIEKNSNKIQLKTGWSIQSWGEKIDIEIIKLENNLYTYLIKSKPIISSSMPAYDKNRKNIQEIISLMQS